VDVVVVALEGDRFALELLRQGPGGMAFLLDDRIGDLDVVTTAIEQARRGQVSLDSGASERRLFTRPMWHHSRCSAAPCINRRADSPSFHAVSPPVNTASASHGTR
jgi:hypothetical protein